MYQHQQQGSVLLWGLVILLTLTVLGVSAIKMASTDTRIAGNQLLYVQAWENSEAVLHKNTGTRSRVLNEVVRLENSNNRHLDFKWLAPQTSDTSLNSGITAVADKSWGAEPTVVNCPPLEGVAMSTRMNGTNLTRGEFVANVRSELSGTGASSRHAEQWCVPIRN
jgi:Tfp pilus assembly protein PilX